MNKKIIVNALINAGITAVYVMGIASFLFYLEDIFGSDLGEKTFLGPAIMLLLLVVSAAVTGLAVFGKPVMWYLDGKKKEALSLFAYTIVFLIIIAFLLILIIYG